VEYVIQVVPIIVPKKAIKETLAASALVGRITA